jgi:hypothetical protein
MYSTQLAPHSVSRKKLIFRAIRHIFDFEDGMLGDTFSSNLILNDTEINEKLQKEDIETVKLELLKHFQINKKEDLMDILYGPLFQKTLIASFTKKLAECKSFFYQNFFRNFSVKIRIFSLFKIK